MAWIKMRMGLATHPKVVRIASALGADRLRAVGGLYAVWSIADEHTEDGILAGYTAEMLDEAVGFPGIARSMQTVDWLTVEEKGLSIPRFEEHNGQSAKRRAEDAKRKKYVREMSAQKADKNRTRVRERERSNTPLPPSGAFLRFWAAWPRHHRKQAQGKCWERWRKDDLDQVAEKIIAHVEAMKLSIDWRKNNGEFIKAPLAYLNQHAWEGAESPSPRPKEMVV